MYPILIQWGELVLPAWHAFFALGALGAYFCLLKLHKLSPAVGVTEKVLGRFFAACYVGGYFGARILSIMIDQGYWPYTFEFYEQIFYFGPMTFYGGFLGAFFSGYAFVKWQYQSVPVFADLSLTAGMVGLCIGRLGCFLNGDDYGIPVALDQEEIPFWAVTFPNHADAIPRVPVQLISSFFAGLIALAGFLSFKKLKANWGDGVVACLTLFAYSVVRFFLEYLRGDQRGWVIEGILSPSQAISLVVGPIAAVVFFRLIRKRSY